MWEGGSLFSVPISFVSVVVVKGCGGGLATVRRTCLMAESGVLEGFPEGIGLDGKSPPVREEMGVMILNDGGYSESPNSRRSARKKSLRSFNSRGRLAKSKPKSPLMRMAEMRKGGLWGRALRHSGIKGLEGADLKSIKGAKGMAGRSLQILASIPESNVVDVALVEGLEGEEGDRVDGGGLGGDVAVMVDDRILEDASIYRGSHVQRPKEGGSKHSKLIPAGDISDLALDLIVAQPFTRDGVCWGTSDKGDRDGRSSWKGLYDGEIESTEWDWGKYASK